MDYTVLVILFFFLGALAGLLSGLLGIGGGLVVVPGLAYLFQIEHAGASYMHMAAGTSLAVMIFTTYRSLRAHLKRGVEFFPIYKQFAPGVVVGVIGGALLAHQLHADVLQIIFGVVVLLISINMLIGREVSANHNLPRPVWMATFGVLIGGKSGLLGIGGGALTIPFLTYFNVSMRQAVVVSVAVGLTVACIGTASFILTGLHVPGLPKWSIGYVHLPAWAAVAAGSVTFAPLGAKFSHAINVKLLKRIFAVFLLIVGIRMLTA